ncbi:MAG: hydantoinase/oxoprolinase family protein [Alicyclobacillus sp.]|nr:hydantoinase/oxoprolinase family protein [Alicyclobacillus sp.]
MTITDCNLVLGYLNPVFLSGELQLDLEAARAAVQRQIAEPLGCSVIEAADAVIRLINVTMAEAVKAISSQRGYDLRRFYLVAFGGGGPIHAGRIALDLGMRGVVVPEYPGVFSALGLLLSDVRHDLMRSRLKPWAQTDPGEVSALLSELREAGAAILAREGFAPAQMAFEAGVDLRYRGQGYELTVPLTRWPETAEDLREIRRRFDDLHEERFGHRAEDAEVDWVQARLTAVGRVERPHLRRAERVAGSQPEAYMMRRAYFPETGAMDVPVYLRQHLSPGMVLTGPAIVEQYDTTIVVYPGMSAVMDEWRNFILRPDQAR